MLKKLQTIFLLLSFSFFSSDLCASLTKDTSDWTETFVLSARPFAIQLDHLEKMNPGEVKFEKILVGFLANEWAKDLTLGQINLPSHYVVTHTPNGVSLGRFHSPKGIAIWFNVDQVVPAGTLQYATRQVDCVLRKDMSRNDFVAVLVAAGLYEESVEE